MEIPPLGADGLRYTVNSNLDENATLWHFRSVWNVAALNCIAPEHQPILDGYGQFLKDNSRTLSAVNTALDAEYRKEYGARTDAVKAREAHMTGVYNYFALPGVRKGLCDTALVVANDYLVNKPTDIKAYAATNMPLFENQYQKFFADYQQYVVDSAAWDARYGERYGASQPGYVAVHGTSGNTIGASLAEAGQEPVAGGVIVDPDDGASIPVLPLPEAESTTATPIVQPVPQGSQ